MIDYINIIKHVLKPGGQFINFGPLLWHWESNEDGEPSIELTLDEVKSLVQKLGFRIDVSLLLFQIFEIYVLIILIYRRKKLLIQHIPIILRVCYNILIKLHIGKCTNIILLKNFNVFQSFRTATKL